MGEATDLFEDLRDRGNEKAEKGDMNSEAEPVGPAEPAAPSAPPADNDLEAPLLGNHGPLDPLPPVLLAAPAENDPLLYVCRVLSIVTAVGALLCLVVNAISLLRSYDYRGFDYRASVCCSRFFACGFVDSLSCCDEKLFQDRLTISGGLNRSRGLYVEMCSNQSRVPYVEIRTNYSNQSRVYYAENRTNDLENCMSKVEQCFHMNLEVCMSKTERCF